MSIQIRKLTRGDRVTLTKLIETLVNQFGADQFTKMLSSGVSSEAEPEKNERALIAIGAQLLQTLMKYVEADVALWFADLVGVTREDYDKLPMDVEVQIINQILDSAEANNFFTGALQISSKIKQFAGQLKNKRIA